MLFSHNLSFTAIKSILLAWHVLLTELKQTHRRLIPGKTQRSSIDWLQVTFVLRSGSYKHPCVGQGCGFELPMVAIR